MEKPKDYVVGFTDLGNTDEFSTEMLEWRLGCSGVINYRWDTDSSLVYEGLHSLHCDSALMFLSPVPVVTWWMLPQQGRNQAQRLRKWRRKPSEAEVTTLIRILKTTELRGCSSGFLWGLHHQDQMSSRQSAFNLFNLDHSLSLRPIVKPNSYVVQCLKCAEIQPAFCHNVNLYSHFTMFFARMK